MFTESRGVPTIAYRIEKDDHDVIDALRRIAIEEIEGAIESAEGKGDVGARVHDIRKRMKKLRGLIRLVRPVFADYEAENAHFRDIARSISEVRDAEVIASTFEGLLDTHSEALELKAFERLRAELGDEKAAAPDLAGVTESLRLARGRIDLWTLRETGWDAIAGGLCKTYRGARKRRKAKGDEALHAWRKPVKYHWYHVRLLHNIWPDEMSAREEAADSMGNFLGIRQDMTVLERRVRKSSLPKETRRVILGLIERRKAETEEEVRALSPRLLEEKPKALVARWGELWSAWRS